MILSLRKKCPYLELFWSAFFLIRTEYREIWSYSGPHFPAFGLNTERYSASLLSQSECGKMRTKITPNRDSFHAVHFCDESNSERRSMETVYMCSTNGFELLFVVTKSLEAV